MTTEEFHKLVNDRHAACNDTLIVKAREYAREDRLSNFKRAAATLGCTPERACVGFWMKHVVSILDMVDDLDKHPTLTASRAMWNEKLADAHNYLTLLEGLVQERIGFDAVPEPPVAQKRVGKGR